MTALAGRRGWLIGAGILLGACLAAFSGVLGNGFVWDDDGFILNNLVLDDLGNAPLIFASSDAVGLAGGNPYYRPLTTMTFALDKALWGTNPAGFHATNLLLHVGVCLIVYTLCRRLVRRPAAALAGALLFAVHPANVEPVAYISARADLLCALFFLASFLLYLKAFDDAGRRRLFLGLSLLCYAAALFSKILALLLPILILIHLLQVAPGKVRRYLYVAPYVLIAAGFLALRTAVLDATTWGVSASFTERAATAGGTVLVQLGHALFPFGLEVFYSRPLPVSLADAEAAGGWIVLLVFAALSLWALRRLPAAALGSALFFGALLPTVGLFMVMNPTPLADRYLYLPLAGMSLAAAALVGRVLERNLSPRAMQALVTGLVVTILFGVGISAARAPLWKDAVSLWEHANRDGVDHPLVLESLGGALLQAGRLDEAEEVFHRLGRKQGYGSDILLFNLGRIAYTRGELATAREYAVKAMEVNPDCAWAMLLLAKCALRSGMRQEAEALVEAARRAEPFNAEVQYMREAMDRALTTNGSSTPPAQDVPTEGGPDGGG